MRDGVVDRAKLGAAVLGEPERLRRLEAIIHPLVREEEEAFLARCRGGAAPLAVLDIPLLFETGGREPLRRGARRHGPAGRPARRASSPAPA